MALFFDTDIHSHIIPAVDDGSQTTSQSIEMFHLLQEYGIKKMFCTPHINPELYSVSNAELTERYNILKNNMENESDIEIRLAGEYMIHEDFLEQDFSDKSSFLTFDGTHILIEMSYMFMSKNIKDVIYELNYAGFSPILAHPERYTFYYDDPKRIKELYSMDCEFQLNYLSLSGKYGKHSMKTIKYLLDNNLYTYIGTDSHTVNQIKTMNDLKLSNKQMDKLLSLAENNKKLWTETVNNEQ